MNSIFREIDFTKIFVKMISRKNCPLCKGETSESRQCDKQAKQSNLLQLPFYEIIQVSPKKCYKSKVNSPSPDMMTKKLFKIIMMNPAESWRMPSHFNDSIFPRLWLMKHIILEFIQNTPRPSKYVCIHRVNYDVCT